MHKPISVEDIIKALVLLARYMMVKEISPIKLEATKQYLWPRKSWSQIPIIAPAGITRKGKPPERNFVVEFRRSYVLEDKIDLIHNTHYLPNHDPSSSFRERTSFFALSRFPTTTVGIMKSTPIPK